MTLHETVEQIYEAEREHLYAYLLYFGVRPQRAQELVQDSFLKLYRRMEKGEVIESPKAWLYRVAHNLALRDYTREPRFDELAPDLAAGEDTRGSDVEQGAIDSQRKAALIQAVRALSPQQRNCLHLRAQGLRYREIAEVVGISTSAVGEFLRRATVRLKEVLDGY
jgi:RNA polymerase sigma-70 factor (ECF subfamily)